jgi:hypothetical protein
MKRHVISGVRSTYSTDLYQKMILKWIFNKWDGVGAGMMWLRITTGGLLL